MMTKQANSSRFINQILIYGFGIVLNHGIGFILLPLYSRLMPVEQFGILEILNRTVQIVSLLMLANYGITFIRFYREKKDPEYRKLVTSTCMIVIFFVAGLIATGTAIFREQLAMMLFKSPEYSFYFVLLAIRYFTDMLFIVPFLYFQATEQPGKYITVSTSKFAILLAFTIWLVYTMEDKVAAVLYAAIITNTIYVATVGTGVFIRSARKIDLGIVVQIFKFTWSFTFLGVYGFIMSNGDRYILNEYCGKAQVGIYSFGYKIGMVLNAIVFSPIIRAWNARMVDVIRGEGGTAHLARLTSYALLIYTTLGFAMSIYSRELVSIVMGERYFLSYQVIPLVIFAYTFWGASLFFDTGIYITKKTYLKTWQGVTAAVSLGLYFWLIPRYCMMGAAWATVGTYFCFFIVSWYTNTRALPTNYEFGKMLRIVTPAIILYLANYYLETIEVEHYGHIRYAAQNGFPVIYQLAIISIKAIFIPAYIGAVWLLKVLEREDFNRISELCSNLKDKFSFRPNDRQPGDSIPLN